jgi:hypothetical protein
VPLAWQHGANRKHSQMKAIKSCAGQRSTGPRMPVRMSRSVSRNEQALLLHAGFVNCARFVKIAALSLWPVL